MLTDRRSASQEDTLMCTFNSIIHLIILILRLEIREKRLLRTFSCSSSAKQETDNPSCLEGTQNAHVKC